MNIFLIGYFIYYITIDMNQGSTKIYDYENVTWFYYLQHTVGQSYDDIYWGKGIRTGQCFEGNCHYQGILILKVQ